MLSSINSFEQLSINKKAQKKLSCKVPELYVKVQSVIQVRTIMKEKDIFTWNAWPNVILN